MPDSSKPRLPPISTSKSATFPSELHQSPVLLSDRPDFIKQEDALLKTPITPPVAYIDFLKSVTPVLASPMKTASPVFSETSSGYSSPTSQPSTANGTHSCTCDIHKPHKLPAISIPPPSPFAHPRSARTPKSLHAQRIPASPATVRSPMSASSPKSATCMSARSQSQFSPSDWCVSPGARFFDPPRSSSGRPVCVRHVVTRTVTYKRTPLEPAPKGKRRKTEQ
ncbi:hypothetical protein PAAG_06435 [Paracoccidioides lutzii Pb01]|uniref:Uncharacterized protein n=1 Tax=Paracoccidioides lutzii (strain ATCC MYA-826 / Pb01) TaxID=502779 RepID=C1H6P4_PARBA|nr:hypothetical protein PAAG_06435 [Paracoccidioides lutzii Pb01]EEH35388.1 hypothetical protein PAAG_06435 [Paracoccidioides lutzii Pb01]